MDQLMHIPVGGGGEKVGEKGDVGERRDPALSLL